MVVSEVRIDRSKHKQRPHLEPKLSKRKSVKAGQSSAKTLASRVKNERRRHIDPTTCERDYSDEEIAFMRAMDEYKRKSGRMFPTWSEVLEVLHCLGYRQVEAAQDLPAFKMG